MAIGRCRYRLNTVPSRPLTLRGFIVQPTYRIEKGRPVVHLFGRLEDGAAFLARDARPVPHFFVRASDADATKATGAVRHTSVRIGSRTRSRS